MEISSRKNILLDLSKIASEEGPMSSEGDNKVVLTEEERRKKLIELRQAINSSSQRMEYSEEQIEILKGYKKLFDEWDTFGAVVHEALQKLGDDITESIAKKFQEAASSLEGPAAAQESGEKRTREEVINVIKQASSFSEENTLMKRSLYEIENELCKIASPENVLKSISNKFADEINKSYYLFSKEANKELGDLTIDSFDSLYPLAVAHTILTNDGLTKEAAIIDEFIVKNAGLLDLAKGAWEGTKKLVKETGTYIGKGLSVAGEAIATGASAALRYSAKGLKYLVGNLAKVIPGIGIVLSLPLAIKNIYEAWNNGWKMFNSESENMSLYGFNKVYCSNPVTGWEHVNDTFRHAYEKYIRSPKDLRKILELYRTIKSFWIDCLFAITNGFFAICDFCVIAGLFFPGVGWIASLAAVGGKLLLNLGVAAIEIGADYFNEQNWKAKEAKLKQRINQEALKIKSEGTPVLEPTSVLAS